MAQKFKTRLNVNAEKQEQISGDTLTFSGNTYFVNPINYVGDVSGSLGVHSLVTKSYVTGITSTISGGTSSVTGATNGVSLVGKNVVLGGDFTGNVVLNGSPTSLFDLNSTIDGNNLSDFLIDPYQIQLTNNTTGETVNTFAVNDHIYFNTRNPLNTKNISILMQLDVMTVDGSSGFTGIEYVNNLSSKFKKYSFVDKNYVTGYSQSHSSIVTYSGTTAPATYALKSNFNTYTGITAPAQFQSHSSIVTYTGTTVPNTYTLKSNFNTFTGTTAPATYKTISSFNSYTASTVNITSANNGLTKSGNNVRLGGNLTGATSIGLGANSLTFTGTSGTLKYGSDLSANYVPRSLVDQGYVYSGITAPFINDINATNKFFAYKTNIDLKGQGQIKLTNGSSAVSGISTNFSNATISGTSFWFTFWVKDSANNWYQLALGAVTDNTHATIAFNFNRSDIRNGLLTNRGAGFPGVSGTYDYYITRNWSDGYLSVAMGNNAYASDYAMAFGGFAIASASNAIALGYYAYAGGNHSVSLGYGNVVTGTSAIGIGYNHNSKADFGAILGGSTHIIPKGSLRSAVIGGNAITVSAAVLDTVHMPKLRIGLGTGGSLTTNNSNTRLLGRNSSTGEIEIVNISGSTLVNAANNGLTRAGNNIHLGGTLTGATTIGLAANSLTFTGTTGTLKYGSDLSAQYNIRSFVDKGYVTGITTTLQTKSAFNTYTGSTNTRISTIETNYITGATNLGSGNGLFTSVSNHRSQFKSLVAGTNISLTPTSTGITITNTAANGLKYITLQVKSSTVVTTGNKGNVIIPYNGTITRWYLNTDVNATVTVDLWKRNGANPNIGDTITGSAQPALSAANYGTSTTLTGWTTAVAVGDKLELDIVANDLATYIQIIIEIS